MLRLLPPDAATGASLPPGPFFATRDQRVALARERFFEEGQRPSGLVPEPVIQSWLRCVGARHRPHQFLAFEPVTRSRVDYTLARSRALLEAAQDEIGALEANLAGTRCKVLLTDRHGVVVHATTPTVVDGPVMRAASRIGVDLAEERVGTTAPGVVAKTGEGCSVLGAEHFFEPVHRMYCAAAPIRDTRGELVGVLDLSSEDEPFRFDPSTVVAMGATAIENRLLVRQSTGHLVLRFHTTRSLLGTPMEGLAGIDAHGRVDWANGAAAQLLGTVRALVPRPSLESVFGLALPALLDLTREDGPRLHRLPCGLGLWLHARLQAPDGLARLSAASRPHDAAVATPAVAPADGPAEPPARAAVTAKAAVTATLHDANRQLIEGTLAELGGNVSRAARRLGVSRGLLYRRLRQWRDGG